jgi:hypothetical protein
VRYRAWEPPLDHLIGPQVHEHLHGQRGAQRQDGVEVVAPLGLRWHIVNRSLPMFCSEFGPGLDHPRSLSDDQSLASSNTAVRHHGWLVIKTLPASYHRPELDLTRDTVAFKVLTRSEPRADPWPFPRSLRGRAG